MKKLTCPIYLHNKPIVDDMLDANFDEAGIHLAPHLDHPYDEEGYHRFVFVWKDGSEQTAAYQLPGHVWEKLRLLLKEV